MGFAVLGNTMTKTELQVEPGLTFTKIFERTKWQKP